MGQGWGEAQEAGVCVHSQLTHIVVQQEPSQHCKAILLQLKNKLKKQKQALESYVWEGQGHSFRSVWRSEIV